VGNPPGKHNVEVRRPTKALVRVSQKTNCSGLEQFEIITCQVRVLAAVRPLGEIAQVWASKRPGHNENSQN
jgi:hypothetical protein